MVPLGHRLTDALGGAAPNPINLPERDGVGKRPGADSYVQGRKAQRRPACLSAGYHPPVAGPSPAAAVIGQTESTTMTIDRPMFPPRAESVDSFLPRPAAGQHEKGKRISESRKPADGLSLGEVQQ